jgi:peptidoglycan/LPS O-acetylase OafA/YrhL
MLVAKLGWRRALILVAGCEILTGGIQGTLGVIYGIDGIEELGKQQSLWHLFYYIAASPLAFWFSWSLGAVIADAYLEKRALPLAKSSLFLWLVLAVGSNFIKPLSPFCFLLFAVSTATAISKLLSGARPGIRIPDFCLKHLRLSGIWSYSIYLLHQPLIGIGISILVMICPVAGSHPLVQFASCLVLWFAIMLIGGLWYRLCELPSIACGKRIIQSAFSGRL